MGLTSQGSCTPLDQPFGDAASLAPPRPQDSWKTIARIGKAARLPFPIHPHMLRHSTGYALAAKGMDTRRLQHYLGHAAITNTVRYTAMSPEPFKDIWRG